MRNLHQYGKPHTKSLQQQQQQSTRNSWQQNTKQNDERNKIIHSVIVLVNICIKRLAND